mmetsp:Transcript_4696/g.11094  ORF Transcript_4696/g.11094 Transcript_4696/m.11094 type:complete len:215 (+) Transcript_4696:536-1180(+)
MRLLRKLTSTRISGMAQPSWTTPIPALCTTRLASCLAVQTQYKGIHRESRSMRTSKYPRNSQAGSLAKEEPTSAGCASHLEPVSVFWIRPMLYPRCRCRTASLRCPGVSSKFKKRMSWSTACWLLAVLGLTLKRQQLSMLRLSGCHNGICRGVSNVNVACGAPLFSYAGGQAAQASACWQTALGKTEVDSGRRCVVSCFVGRCGGCQNASGLRV